MGAGLSAMTSAALHDGRSRQTRADLGGNEKGDGRFGDRKKKEEMDEQLVIMISGRKQTNADLMKNIAGRCASRMRIATDGVELAG